MRFIRNIYLTNRPFWIIAVAVICFCAGFSLPFMMYVGQAILILLVVTIILDIFLLHHTSTRVQATRSMSNVLSLSDENWVHIDITSKSRLPLHITIIDELPYQLQKRDFKVELNISPNKHIRVDYPIRPYVRGAYAFGHIMLFISNRLKLAERRIVAGEPQSTPVYPSIIQMRAYELKTMQSISFFAGVKKMKRIGHSYEFDQIKQYVRGDDIRHINWKATGRTGNLMVNHYEEERSQQIFSIIDKSRSMRMPFNDLSLMDYAINTTLTISNIAMKKEDRVGLITFSDAIETTLHPDKHPRQLRKIMEALYNEKERYTESNFELLYQFSRSFIRVRSLVFLFTNFESLYAIERVVGILRKLNKLHLLVVVFFENAEITDYGHSEAANLEEVYLTTIADKFSVEKQQILKELLKYGIQTIVTRPEDLSINTINKYLELKSRGLI